MNLEKLYEMQAKLDKHILEKHNLNINEKELLKQTQLALLVEIGELANATRCFKHWSTKDSEPDERLLDELADIWHFYFSIGNQRNIKLENIEEADNYTFKNLTDIFNCLYYLSRFSNTNYYKKFGIVLIVLTQKLNLTNKDVKLAYLKKHEENYKRQREGY